MIEKRIDKLKTIYYALKDTAYESIDLPVIESMGDKTTVSVIGASKIETIAK